MAVLLAFITNGILMATWVSRIPAVQGKLGLSDSELGLVLVGFSAGMFTALFLTGGLIARFGSPKVVLVSTLASCIALPFLVLISQPILLFVVLFIFGAGISAADVAMNEQAVFVERNAGHSLMSSFHGAYSMGGLSGALISAGMASVPGLPPLSHFIMVAIVFSSVMVFVYRNLVPAKRGTAKTTAMFRLPERAVLMLGVIAFCSSIGEETVADWGAVYLTQVLKTDDSFAALGYGAFSLTMTIMRLVGDFLSTKWAPKVIIRTGSIIAAVGLLAASLTESPIVVVAGLAAVGVGLANIVPLLFGAAGNLSGISPGSGIAGVATIGFSGFLVGPPLIGFLAGATSLRSALLLPALLVGSMAFTASTISSHRDKVVKKEI